MTAQPAASAAHPAATMVTMPPTPLLPEKFGPWVADGSVAAASTLSLADDVAKELIVQRSDSKRYIAQGNAAVVSATEFADATGAYSAFTLMRTLDSHPCASGNTLGVDCAATPGRVLFWAGDTLVAITPAGALPISVRSFSELADVLPKPVGAKGAHPLLPTRLPTDGLEATSIRYAVGPVTYAAQGGQLPASLIDFSKSPEILTARYRGSKSGSGVLTAVFYPTPTIAGERMRAMQAAVQGKLLPASFLAGDPQAARSGPIVALASSGLSKKQATKLANAVHYDAAITWNKPEGYMDQFKVTKAASVMVQIMFFVFMMTAAALILGIFFGGGRALLRKARGKPVSSIDDLEIISLDLRGRPTNRLQ